MCYDIVLCPVSHTVLEFDATNNCKLVPVGSHLIPFALSSTGGPPACLHPTVTV